MYGFCWVANNTKKKTRDKGNFKVRLRGINRERHTFDILARGAEPHSGSSDLFMHARGGASVRTDETLEMC